MKAFYISAGGFSLVNDRLYNALQEQLAGGLERLDALEMAFTGRPLARFASIFSTICFYHRVIAKHRIPPRDLIVRMPLFQRCLSDRIASLVKGASWTLQTQSLFDASCKGIPHFVYTDHTFRANRRYNCLRPTWPVPSDWLRMEEELYKNSALVFSTSGFAARSMVEDYGIPRERAVVTWSGCNVDPPTSIPERSGKMRRILFVGVEWERKGGPVLVEAFSRLRAQFPELELDVVGCEGKQEGIRFHGRLKPSDMQPFFEKADIFCLPSIAEPSAVALTEASGFGLPVVATRVGGSPERVLEGETGLLVEPSHVEDLCGAIQFLIKNPEAARKMGIVGRERVLRDFTWDAVAAKVLGQIRSIVPNSP